MTLESPRDVQIENIRIALTAIEDILDDVRTQLVKLANLEPEDAKLTKESPDLASGPGCVCDVCDKELPLDEARKAGWTDIARWNGGGKAAFLGICGDHKETDAPPATPKKPGTLFSLEE